MARRKCDVCGLYRGAKPHTGALHDKIRANQNRVSKAGRSFRPRKPRLPRWFR